MQTQKHFGQDTVNQKIDMGSHHSQVTHSLIPLCTIVVDIDILHWNLYSLISDPIFR